MGELLESLIGMVCSGVCVGCSGRVTAFRFVNVDGATCIREDRPG